jgi:HEPN domain-containing protein
MARDLFQGISDQEKAGKHRMADAEALFAEKRWRGSMYLAGYAVECLLKARLMRKFGCRHLDELEGELHRRRLLPEHQTVFTHELEILMGCAGALARLRQDRSSWQTFNFVNQWVPAWRYNTDLSNHDTADDFLAAVRTILHWIENNI